MVRPREYASKPAQSLATAQLVYATGFIKAPRHATTQVLAFERQAVAPGVALIAQGSRGDYFYVVETGCFDFLVHGGKVGDCGPGGSFGELALLYDTKVSVCSHASTRARPRLAAPLPIFFCLFLLKIVCFFFSAARLVCASPLSLSLFFFFL